MEKEWALSDTNTNFVLSDFFFFCFNSLSLLLCGSRLSALLLMFSVALIICGLALFSLF